VPHNVNTPVTLTFDLHQVAVKNNIDVFYFSVLIPLNIFFVEDGKMGKSVFPEHYRRSVYMLRNMGPHAVCSAERQVFLATWKDIPNENELQYQIKECHLNAGGLL